jgi:hypothetical protein
VGGAFGEGDTCGNDPPRLPGELPRPGNEPVPGSPVFGSVPPSPAFVLDPLDPEPDEVCLCVRTLIVAVADGDLLA